MSTEIVIAPGATVIGPDGKKIPAGQRIVLTDEQATQIASLTRRNGKDRAMKVRVANGTVYTLKDGAQKHAGEDVVIEDAEAAVLVGLGSMVPVGSDKSDKAKPNVK